MAEQNEPEKEQQQQPAPEQAQQTKDDSSGRNLMTWIILAVAVLISAGAGFGLGKLFADKTGSQDQNAPPPTENPAANTTAENSTAETDELWYYDLDPVVANLDEPGATRYVRAALTLAVSSSLDKAKGTALLEAKKPLLTNCLTIFLASLSLDDIRGERNLRLVQTEMLDMINAKLFPGKKGQIKQVLFKEFAVQ